MRRQVANDVPPGEAGREVDDQAQHTTCGSFAFLPRLLDTFKSSTTTVSQSVPLHALLQLTLGAHALPPPSHHHRFQNRTMAPPQSTSDAAAEHKKQSEASTGHHGEEHKAHDKPSHEFGTTGKPMTTQGDLTKKVEEE